MRRTIRILSYIGLAIATAALIILFASGIPLPQANQSIALAKPFNDFPVNEPQFVDFRLDEASFGSLSDREKQDQLRDWLLFTIASDQDLSAKEINESLYDLSTTRQGYMRPVSNFEYGSTRSIYVGDGEVVALIPAKLTAPERTDALAHIADKHRKDLGQKPTELLVFEYELNLAEQYGVLTHREVIDANKFFTDQEGYIESKVSTLNDLRSFMRTVDDLTYAQLAGDQLILGGRKIQGRAYEGIQVEDIAAIWQSEEKIRSDLAAFNARWNARINAAPASQQSQLEKQAYAESEALGLVSGSGFSLDPDYDYASLFNILKAAEPGLSKVEVNGKLAIGDQDIQRAKQGLNPQPLTSSSNSSSILIPDANIAIDSPGRLTNPVAQSTQLQHDVVPYLELLESLKTVIQQSPEQTNLTQTEIDNINALLNSDRSHQFQKARYDGNLQGTEVGMVLFYTDLLAKLWVLDHKNSTPQEAVADFAPLTTVSSNIASIYKQEIEDLPSTRLWFGPQDKGFQPSTADNSLLFARNATRIYAASSDPLQPGKETFAAANSEAFLGWWNDHYEEVAAYEPQYERLNEIMKWSLLVGWLNNAEQGDILSFLKNVQVQRNFWFPDWAKAQGDRLRFKDWESIQFYPKGYLGTTTEAMEILDSEDFTFFGNPTWRISGGVSLADEGLFQGRKSLSSVDDLDTIAYRSNIDYSTLQAEGDRLNFTTLEGTAYRLFNQQPTLASVAAKAKEGNKLRGRLSELANLEFVKDVARTRDGLSVSTLVDGTELGRLKTSRTGNGFTVGWSGRDIDDGQLLVQQIKQAPHQSIDQVLRDHPLVVAVVQLDDGGRYAIKLQGAEDWMEIAGGGGGSDLPPDWQARVGSFPDDPSGIGEILLRWVDDEQVQKQLSENTARLIIDHRRKVPKELDSDELLQSLTQHNYEQVAQQIADNPAAVHQIVREHLKAELKIIDDLRQRKQTARALQQLDELIALYGRQPDLMLRKALLDIDRRRLLVQRIDPNGVGSISASRGDFYSVVNQILSSSDDSNHFKAVVTDDEVIYIQDSPSFNNIDPSTPIGDAFPFGSEARAYRVESGSIGDAHIGSSGYDNPVAALLPGSGDASNPNTFNLNNFSRAVNGGGNDDTCEEAPAEGDPHCRQVYVVIDETMI